MATDAAEQRAADLALALALADAADAVTTARFRADDLVVESKPDTTPVTDADRAVERLLRAQVAERHPADAFLGEEYGASGVGADDAGRRWIVDPIDGTKNYARGVPVWATLIALQENGIGTVGVVSAPALGRRWWAATGHGAWLAENGGEPRRLAVSGVGALADASLSYSSFGGWGEGFFALAGAVWRTRAYGDFWSYMLLAEGAVDLAAEPEVSLWDLAALDVVVREAGGTFTALDGTPGPAGGTALASNGLLHASALRLLDGAG